MKISENARIVISVHGAIDKGETVFVGGRNQELKQRILHALRTAGFTAVISEIPGLGGIKPDNFCNRCKSGEGVQLEISRGLREKMFENITRRSLRKKTKMFYNFVHTIKEVLSVLGFLQALCLPMLSGSYI